MHHQTIKQDTMSAKNSSTTADYLEWDSAISLIHKLYRDGDYLMSLFVGCGCFFGLRCSDLRALTWNMLAGETFTIIEQKTGKRRTIRINSNFSKHIEDCKKAMRVENDDERCFIGQKGSVLTIQRINVRLKQIKKKYHLNIDHISTHTWRKTFGRRVVEMAGSNAEMALIKLSELFQHSSIKTTRLYLGLRKEQLLECYSMLDF